MCFGCLYFSFSDVMSVQELQMWRQLQYQTPPETGGFLGNCRSNLIIVYLDQDIINSPKYFFFTRGLNLE